MVTQLRGKNAYSDPLLLSANSFGNYFASTSRVTPGSSQSHGLCSLKNSLRKSALLPTITDVDQHCLVFSFKEPKPIRIDGISGKNVRRNFAALPTALLFMLNGFITTDVIPRTLK